MASLFEQQLIVIYCREEALAMVGEKLTQFLRGLACIPVSIDDGALVISDNGDLYGTVTDLHEREYPQHCGHD